MNTQEPGSRAWGWMMLVVIGAVLWLAPCTWAQSGIQWSANAKGSIERAAEMGVPIMFWLTEHADWDDDGLRDLKDAQQDAFRDSVVAGLAERYFVPCRVARNSRVLEEAQRLGLPTEVGLYIAIVTPKGEVLDRIDPGQVASAETLAARLSAASRAYREKTYAASLKATITDPEAQKSKVGKAVREVWRTRMYCADADVAKLLDRGDVTPEERQRLYQLLAAFGTPVCVEALLVASEKDKRAGDALLKAEPAAIPALLQAMPGAQGEVSERQVVAYRAVAAIVKSRAPKDEKFWKDASNEERQKELDRVRSAAEAVHTAWEEREGRWR
jgi:hypothetical protein